jgi:hypothetical protein
VKVNGRWAYLPGPSKPGCRFYSHRRSKAHTVFLLGQLVKNWQKRFINTDKAPGIDREKLFQTHCR